MKKTLLFVTLIGLLPLMAQAIEPTPGGVIVPETFTSLGQLFNLIQSVLNWFFVFIIVMAIFYMLYVALRYILSGGKKETVQGIGTALTYIIVGIIVAVVAKGIIYAVCQFFTTYTCRIF